ncbi:MAG: hypothetical protein P4L42_00190 [Desulfocapsaceae bacterium]|nr:hypothetical protein [Desulfocapsaceae bacterium]
MIKILPALLLILFSSSVVSAAGDPAAPKDPAIRALIDKQMVLSDKCRGGYGDSAETKRYCQERDKTLSELKTKGWCWGYPGQIETDKVWHLCSEKFKPEKKSPYFLSVDAWKCPAPTSLGGDQVHNTNSGCIPASGKLPENIVVMDIEKEFAYICTPFRYGKEFIEGFTSVVCSYVLVSSIIDKDGHPPDLEKMKAYASKQTIKDVKEQK